jgi:hypothetical protein
MMLAARRAAEHAANSMINRALGLRVPPAPLIMRLAARHAAEHAANVMINPEDAAERGQGEVATLGYPAAVKRGAKTGMLHCRNGSALRSVMWTMTLNGQGLRCGENPQ